MLDNNPFLVYIIYKYTIYSLFLPGYDTEARIRGCIIPARILGQDAILSTAQVSNHQESTTARFIMEEISRVRKHTEILLKIIAHTDDQSGR